jgi:L-alanine-DL-glutamate epimerase-like enolase superfamily enzyme
VTGETVESVERILRETVEPRVVGENLFRWGLILEDLRLRLREHSSARAALDMALLDLFGKSCGVPIWQLLGGYRDSIETSVTVGILPEAETVHAARKFVARGFRCLKLKGGLDVDDDVSRVLRVREALGAGVELRFDANQGYTFDDTVRFVDGARKADLELIEQPTAASETALLGRVTTAVDLPVMADESLKTTLDAFRLAEGELVDLVNVKVMKVGGLAVALQIDAVARIGGIQTMVGCFDESEVGIAAGLAFALARPNVAYADLDGHLDLIGDPAAGSLRLRDGVLLAPTAPGLGVAVDEA